MTERTTADGRFEEQVQAWLRQEADRVPPSVDAYAIADAMRDARHRRRRRIGVAIGAGWLAAAVMVGLVVGGVGQREPVGTTPEPSSSTMVAPTGPPTPPAITTTAPTATLPPTPTEGPSSAPGGPGSDIPDAYANGVRGDWTGACGSWGCVGGGITEERFQEIPRVALPIEITADLPIDEIVVEARSVESIRDGNRPPERVSIGETTISELPPGEWDWITVQIVYDDASQVTYAWRVEPGP